MNKLEAVSKLANILKTNNRDEQLPRRFILKVLVDTSKQLISQKLLDRTIMSELNLYTEINCFEFEKINAKDCPLIEFRLCKTLMKSKKPLPELVFSRLGSSVKEIYSLDGDYQFTFVDLKQYNRNKKRQHSLTDEVYVYLGIDNHLYIPDHEIKVVDLSVLTLKPEEVQSCKKQECKSYWEYDFISPDKLIDVIFDKALQTLGVTRQITSDQNPNNAERQ